jgi:flagellar motility protein MotE (MotC chaperone)
MTSRRGRRPLRRYGALPILAGILLASGLLRLGGETGQAIAREVVTLAAAGDVAGCTPDADIAAVLAALQEREGRIVGQEAQIAQRQAALAEAEAEIARQLATLKDAEAGLEQLIATADSAAEDDLARLTAVYENMKPKDAAALFQEMAPQFAAGFLGRMRPDSAARVMAGLDPTTAYSISVMLAGRNAEAPRN